MIIIDKSIMDNIIQDYENGLNTEKISEKYHEFSPYIIRENLRLNGKLKGSKISEEELNNIVLDYKNGMSLDNISLKYKRPQETLRKKLKGLDLYKNIKSYHIYTDKDIDVIRKYYPSGDWDVLLKLLPDKPKSSIINKACSLGIQQINRLWNEHDIKNILSERGYKLMSHFTNIREKHLISDTDGYLYYIQLDSFCYKDNYAPLKFSKNNIYTIDNIKNYIKINNIDCELLSNTYINNTSDLKWKCHCDKTFLCSWNNFLNGKHQCNECSKIISLNKISYSISDVQSKISVDGYTIIDETFSRLSNGFDAFDKDGYRVRMNKDNVLKNKKPERFHAHNPNTIYNINHYLELNNITTKLISTTYINNNEPLKWQCSCTEFFERDWAHFSNGSTKCLKCALKENGLKRRNTLDEIVSVVENMNFHLYENIESIAITDRKFSVYDDECYIYETNWGGINSGKYPEKFHPANKYTIKNINNFLKLERNSEYECISETYTGNDKLLKFKHKSCGCIFDATWSEMQGKLSPNRKDKYYKQCPNCNTNKTESNHASILKQIFLHEYPDTTLEDKSCINPKTNYPLPTDIVNHRLKIAIEVQSEFHDREEKIPIDKFKKEFWINKGYAFYDPDIRDYSILEMIQLFFPFIKEIPSYINYNFSNCIDFNLVQDLLNDGYSIKEIHEKTGIKRGTIHGLITAKKVKLPEDYKYRVLNIRPIVRLTKDNKFIKRYESLSSVNNDGFASGTVRRVLIGEQDFSYDSFWVYEDSYLLGEYTIPKEKEDHYNCPVAKYNINDEFICSYASIYEAEKDSISNRTEIYRVAKGDRKSSRNEKWKFINVA